MPCMQIVQAARENNTEPSCPVCRRMLLSRDPNLLDVDNAKLDLLLQGAAHASMDEVAAAFEKPEADVPRAQHVAQAVLLSTPTGDVFDGGCRVPATNP